MRSAPSPGWVSKAAQTRTPAGHLRVGQSKNGGTAAQQHTALGWRWKIRLHEFGLDSEASAARNAHLRQQTSRPQSPTSSVIRMLNMSAKGPIKTYLSAPGPHPVLGQRREARVAHMEQPSNRKSERHLRVHRAALRPRLPRPVPCTSVRLL